MLTSFVVDLMVTAITYRHDNPPNLECQGFLQVPDCPSPSHDEEEDEEANTNEPIKTQYSCYKYVQIKTISSSDHNQRL
jgi:hypothetical protein